ncbi:hypothetical protein [Ramlibacter sp.]|uniref:hypothetical protein n=1 Tax=Ramlibacter sp. TaxID=1917967 RepID=UPI003D0E45A7
MTTPYVNVHGEPIGVSARDAVVMIEPLAYSQKSPLFVSTVHIRRGRADGKRRNADAIIGSGANEESA